MKAQTLHGTVIFTDQLGWCQGGQLIGIYASPISRVWDISFADRVSSAAEFIQQKSPSKLGRNTHAHTHTYLYLPYPTLPTYLPTYLVFAMIRSRVIEETFTVVLEGSSRSF